MYMYIVCTYQEVTYIHIATHVQYCHVLYSAIHLGIQTTLIVQGFPGIVTTCTLYMYMYVHVYTCICILPHCTPVRVS